MNRSDFIKGLIALPAAIIGAGKVVSKQKPVILPVSSEFYSKYVCGIDPAYHPVCRDAISSIEIVYNDDDIRLPVDEQTLDKITKAFAKSMDEKAIEELLT